jgi:hypothetical protein
VTRELDGSPFDPEERHRYGRRWAFASDPPWRPVHDAKAVEVIMSSRSDLHTDFEKLTADATQMADENARLRKINAEMLAALQYTLPILQDGLPETVNFDSTKEAVAKVQNAIAEAERET